MQGMWAGNALGWFLGGGVFLVGEVVEEEAVDEDVAAADFAEEDAVGGCGGCGRFLCRRGCIGG